MPPNHPWVDRSFDCLSTIEPREKTKPSENPSFEPMRVAILGVGGLGRTLASELRGDPRVTSLLLVDLFGERARGLTASRGRVAPVPTQLHGETSRAAATALGGPGT